MDYQERTYHGLRRGETGPVILVEEPVPGWSERQNVTVLYELPQPKNGSFQWGYNGTGPGNMAIAVLSDALDVDAAEIGFVTGTRWGSELRKAFCAEVVAELCDEWRLNRRAVLRWAAGWYHQLRLPSMPEILNEPSLRLGHIWSELTRPTRKQ